MNLNDKFEILAKGRYGKVLREVLEETKRQVADIRTPLKSKPELENQVRLGIIEAIDIFLVDKLKVLTGDLNPTDPNEHI